MKHHREDVGRLVGVDVNMLEPAIFPNSELPLCPQTAAHAL